MTGPGLIIAGSGSYRVCPALAERDRPDAVLQHAQVRGAVAGRPGPALAALLSSLPGDPEGWLVLQQRGWTDGLGMPGMWTVQPLDEEGTGPLVAPSTGLSKVLRAAAGHPDPLVRLAAAVNVRSAGTAVQRQLGDSEPAVSAAARSRLLEQLAA